MNCRWVCSARAQPPTQTVERPRQLSELVVAAPAAPKSSCAGRAAIATARRAIAGHRPRPIDGEPPAAGGRRAGARPECRAAWLRGARAVARQSSAGWPRRENRRRRRSPGRERTRHPPGGVCSERAIHRMREDAPSATGQWRLSAPPRRKHGHRRRSGLGHRVSAATSGAIPRR